MISTPILGMFNIVMLAIGLFIWGLIFLCLIVLGLGIWKRSKLLIARALGIPLLFIGCCVGLDYLGQEDDPFPFTKVAPQEESLVGTYILDQSSQGFLQGHGFNDFSGKIVLKSDHTFQVTQMPHLWAELAKDNSGYDNCTGIWSIATGGEGYYEVTLMTPGAADTAEFLNVSAPKGGRTDPALMVPVFDGDFSYFAFVRKHP